MQVIRVFLVWFCLVVSATTLHAEQLSTVEQTKQIWQLLDYLAVDYAKSVKEGAIASQSEYAEMQEFAHAARQQLAVLPTTPQQVALLSDADALRQSIAQKAPSDRVGDQAHRLAAALLMAYPVPVSPLKTPDLRQGAALYQSNCAACHGVSGHADGPLASSLNPQPIALADHARARERSVFALQQIVTRGVEGTSMASFAKLTEDERWAVAYFASTLSYSDADRQAGAKLWAERPELHAAFPTLAKLSESSESALTKAVDADVARGLTAYLRSAPGTLAQSNADTLPIAMTKLKASVAALETGDMAAAARLGLSAYLDGFEPVEPALAAKNNALFSEIEKTMGDYRHAVSTNNLAQARATATRLQGLLSDAQGALDSSNDPLSTFIGALTILLREGVEALLVVVAMLAFLKKAGRQDVLPYVHAGWIAALAGGALTWAVATYLVDLSGASREMTEGFSAIFAAVVLLAVGIWMHQKSLAGRWQAYVKDKLSSALNKRSAAMLFLLSFVTVYREVFETVLFYVALWTEHNGVYLLAGLGTGIVILAVIAVLLLRSSAKLPISQFFAYSSALVAVLAVILAGKGVAALQKVGFLDMTPVAVPRVEVLGIYPTAQTLAAQVVILAIIAVSIRYNLRSQNRRG